MHYLVWYFLLLLCRMAWAALAWSEVVWATYQLSILAFICCTNSSTSVIHGLVGMASNPCCITTAASVHFILQLLGQLFAFVIIHELVKYHSIIIVKHSLLLVILTSWLRSLDRFAFAAASNWCFRRGAYSTWNCLLSAIAFQLWIYSASVIAWYWLLLSSHRLAPVCFVSVLLSHAWDLTVATS